MKITMQRWVAACVLGCAFISVLAIPSASDSDESPVYRWRLQQNGIQDRVEQRLRAVSGHTRGLMAEFRSAEDSARATHVFGPPRVKPSRPDVWFAPDIPERSRRAVSDLIAREVEARGEWRGRGPVGVMVITDTFTTIDRVKMPVNYNRDRPLTTAVFAGSGAIAGRCVTVIRLRHQGLNATSLDLRDRPPLDGCAFTDAFGTPGPKIAEWLARDRYVHARRLVFEQPKDEQNVKRYAWDDGDVAGRACRAGDDQACLAEVLHQDGRYNYFTWWGRDLSVGVPTESWETLDRFDVETDAFLESLARDMGPARFQRMWQSPKQIEEAYFDQTGETFAGWVRTHLISFYGTYRVGALPAPAANVLTILLVVALAGISIRLTARPSVA